MIQVLIPGKLFLSDYRDSAGKAFDFRRESCKGGK